MNLKLESCPLPGPDRGYIDRMVRTLELWARRLQFGGTDVLLPSITDKVPIGSTQLAWASIYLANGTDATAGTTATINKSTGRFRVQAGASVFNLVNSRISSEDTVICLPCQNDAFGRVNAVESNNGGATVFLTGPVADMDVQFLVVKV